MKTQVLFIRHGNTKSNLEGRYLGQTDEPLCQEGKAALQNMSRYADRPDYVFTGPMVRCQETREILFPEMDYYIVQSMTEIDFGEFEGMTYSELNGNKDYQAWIDSGGTIAFPKGESREDFIARSMKAFYEICGEIISGSYSKVAVIMHGGNIMAILSSLTGGEYFDYQVKPGKGYRCSLEIGKDIKLVEIEDL